MGFELRQYQKECIETVNSLPDGTRTIVCLATGLGKTLTAANFETKGRILWLSHRDELVRQPEKYFKARGVSYCIEKNGEKSDASVISVSMQSMAKDKRLHSYDPKEFDVIILDEAHHAAAPTYRKVLGYFKPRKLIGLTATPKRGDGVKLSDLFDDICFIRDLKWGIENNYLCKLRCVRVSASFDLGRVKKSMGDLMISGMAKEMLDSDDDLVVTRAYMEYSLPEHKKTLIYCPTVDICHLILETMRRALKETDFEKVAVLSDKSSAHDRKKMLESFMRDDGLDCIINCMILTEGTDLPATSVIINNRPTANPTLYQQIVGRGTRLYPGKEYCLIVDVMGENAKEKYIVSAPTLFGVDPDLLPDKVRKELEKGDLLELSNDLLNKRGSAAISLKLRKELIDIFTGERLAIIKDNISSGLKKVAEAYSDTIEIKENEIDFGDIMVKRQPEEDKHFCIPATYNGNIYISKPDMLGKSFVTVEIPHNETIDKKTWNAISKPMPVEDAIRVVGDILRYSVKKDYILRWSRTARANMNRAGASDKQLSYVSALYKKERNGEEPDTNGLSKLQASDLIDLYHEIGTLETKSNLLKMEEERRKRGKPAIIPDDGFEKRNSQYKSIILETYKRKRTYERALEAAEESGEVKSVTVDIGYDALHLSIRKMSGRQRDFINSLIEELNAKHIITDGKVPELDMWRAGILIGGLKKISSLPLPPEGMEYRIRLMQFFDNLKELETDQKSITITYSTGAAAPLFEEL